MLNIIYSIFIAIRKLIRKDLLKIMIDKSQVSTIDIYNIIYNFNIVTKTREYNCIIMLTIFQIKYILLLGFEFVDTLRIYFT